jgi:glycoside/pentoside/hexuronide:cation symporter, GPH family
MLPLTVALAIWRVREPAAGEQPAISLADYRTVLANGSVRRLMIADLLLGWAPGITGALFLFYFDQVKGVPETEANLLLLIYFVAAMVGAPLWSALAVRIGKHRAVAVNCLTIVVTLLLVMLAPMRSFAFAAAVMALAGLPYSGSALLRAMLADAGDELRLETGVERTGLLYSMLTATNKIGTALALVSFVILDEVGFRASAAHNPPAALAGLQAVFVGGPALLSLLAAVVILGYRLDSGRHAEIRAALSAEPAPDSVT